MEKDTGLERSSKLKGYDVSFYTNLIENNLSTHFLLFLAYKLNQKRSDSRNESIPYKNSF